MSWQKITLTFRLLPTPDDRRGFSGDRRLKALLKVALRSLGMRCERIEDDNGECQPMVDTLLHADQGGADSE